MLTVLIHRIRKTTYEFGKEMKFDLEQVRQNSPRDGSMIKLLQPLSWLLEFQQSFNQKTLMNFVIDLNYYYKTNKLEAILTYLTNNSLYN